MQDWFHSILYFLYKENPFDGQPVLLNDFFRSKLNISNDDIGKAKQIVDVLNHLKNNEFVEWEREPILMGGVFGQHGIIHTDPPKDSGTLEYHKVSAILTIKGYDYFAKRERLIEQHSSIITTNNSVRGTNIKTWIIAALAAIFAALTFFKSCRQDQQWQYKLLELKEQLQDSCQQIRETVASDVHRLEDSLKKISKPIDTAALRHNPIDKKHN